MRDLAATISSLHQQAAKDKIVEQKKKVRTNDRSTQMILQQQSFVIFKRQRDEFEKARGTPSKKTKMTRPRALSKPAGFW